MKIGIVINHGEDSDSKAIPAYNKIRQMAQAAEAGGLDSIWLFDHLIFRFDDEEAGIWECWTLLCALAEATNRVELGTIVLCNPFRNPALLAKMAHTLDEISGGRLILGLGAGWHKPEFDAFGYDFNRRVDRFEEAVQILRPLLRGERVNFSGTHYQAKDCAIIPTGPRSEGIPLLVGAFGPRMLSLTAQYADQWNTAWLGDAAPLAERVQTMHDACNKVGRDPDTLAVTVGVQIIFPDLGKVNNFTKEPLTGTTEELAAAFQKYEQAGAAHLIIYASPSNLSAVERVATAVRHYKSIRAK